MLWMEFQKIVNAFIRIPALVARCVVELRCGCRCPDAPVSMSFFENRDETRMTQSSTCRRTRDRPAAVPQARAAAPTSEAWKNACILRLLLGWPVHHRRNAQLSHPAARLGDFNSTHRLRPAGAVSQRGDDSLPCCSFNQALRSFTVIPFTPAALLLAFTRRYPRFRMSRWHTSFLRCRVKARPGSNAVGACDSSCAEGRVPPSLLAP